MSENTRPRGSPSPFFDQNHLHVTSNPNYNATASTSAIGKGLLDFRDSGRTSSTSLTTQQHHQRDRVLSDRNGMNSLFPNVASTKKSGFSEEDDRVDEEDGEETNIVGPFDFSSIKESTPPPPSSSLPPSSSPYASSVHDETPIHEVTPVAQRRVDFSALASAKKGRSTKKVKGSAKKNTTTTKESVNPTTTQEGNDNDSATIDNMDKEKPGEEMMLGLDLDVSMVISPDSSNGTHVEERIQVQQQRMQLISPPPEETLGALRRLSWGKPPAAATTLDDKDSDIKTPVTNVAPASATKRKRGTPRGGGKQKQAAGPTVPVIEEEDGDMRMRNTVNASEEDNEAATRRTREEEEPVEATPNPKPRKLGRRMINMEDEEDQDGDEDSAGLLTTPTKSKTKAKSVLIQSPHVANPEADYVPPLVLPAAEGAVARRAVLGARGSRRSATPIPPYEPPEDVFTPPREVWSPAPVTTSRRSATPSGGRTGKGKAPARATTSAKKSGAKGKGKTVLKIVTQVKQELPDIDLTAPMPPPSPTDDPLLLSGPPEEFLMMEEERREIPRMMSVEAQVQTDDIEGGVDTGGAWEERDGEEQGPAVDVLPPSSPEPYFDSDDMRAVDAFESEKERRDQGTSGMPSCTEEEDSMMDDDPVAQGVSPVRLFECEAGVGAETGGWSDSDEEEDRRVIGEQIEEGEGEYTGHFRTLRIPTKEDPPSSATRARQEEWGRPISPYPYKRLSLIGEQKQEEEKEKEKEPQVAVEDEEDEEEREVREMSLTLEEEPEVASQQVHEEALLEEEATEDSEDSDMENDPGLVKITSADPRAAARAAAILKQHDYDCFTKIAMKKRRQRASHSTVDSLIKNARKRDLVGSAGITKSSKAKAQRRSFAFTGGVVDGERVVIPGSPSTTLPELLYEAEQEVSRVMTSLPSPGRAASPNWSMTSIDRPQQNPFLTPAPRLRPSISSSANVYRDTIGPDFIGEAPWTKEEWKLLDACFTDERLEVGEKMRLEGAESVEYDEHEEVLAPVDMVRVEDVVERFVTFIGGRDVAERRGEAWARTNLIERARALQKKQRAGNVAKPTTPRSSMSNSSFAGTHAWKSRISRLSDGQA
ncbi:hypothetical protein CPC08DRAFT_703800 [Agrocybe pediades]|nr:hypothetical protein CPC08DRAFT_703800 [Agrocybe pediades]